METNTIIELINSVGFPIVCCIALFYLNIKNNNRYEKQLEEIKKVVENNTTILNQLLISVRDK